jgi:ubiquinone/menaquinone biosynthesis C-methylase UbiE
VYDIWAALTESKSRRRCLELAAVRDGESVLEVAVGTGLVFEALLRANPSGRNVGVDLTEAMLERARRRASRVGGSFELRRGDAHRLEFADGTFDLVVNNYMFDLLPEEDFVPVLREFRRVLRPGGRLVLVNMAHGERWHQRLYDWVYRLKPSLMGGCRGVALEPYVLEAGFVQVHREALSQMGFPSEVLRAEVPAPLAPEVRTV